MLRIQGKGKGKLGRIRHNRAVFDSKQALQTWQRLRACGPSNTRAFPSGAWLYNGVSLSGDPFLVHLGMSVTVCGEAYGLGVINHMLGLFVPCRVLDYSEEILSLLGPRDEPHGLASGLEDDGMQDNEAVSKLSPLGVRFSPTL
jgi:hypothetical protein